MAARAIRLLHLQRRCARRRARPRRRSSRAVRRPRRPSRRRDAGALLGRPAGADLLDPRDRHDALSGHGLRRRAWRTGGTGDGRQRAAPALQRRRFVDRRCREGRARARRRVQADVPRHAARLRHARLRPTCAHLRLTTNAYRAATVLLDAMAHEYCDGRWLATGGGGYDAYRVVPRSWSLVWLAQAHREPPLETDEGWRASWDAEAERFDQSPPPDTYLDARRSGRRPKSPDTVARNAKIADQALTQTLELLEEKQLTRSERGYVEFPGSRIYYEVDGDGPALTFVHACVAHLRMWDAQVEAFKDRYTVVRHDLRGFGKTTTEDVPYSNSDDLRRVLDHLGIEPNASGRELVRRNDRARLRAAMARARSVAHARGQWDRRLRQRRPDAHATVRRDGTTLEGKGLRAGRRARDAEWTDGPGQPATRVDPAVRAQDGRVEPRQLSRRAGETSTTSASNHQPRNASAS